VEGLLDSVGFVGRKVWGYDTCSARCMEDYPGIVFGLIERFSIFVDRSLVVPQPFIQIRDRDIPYMRTFGQYSPNFWR